MRIRPFFRLSRFTFALCASYAPVASAQPSPSVDSRVQSPQIAEPMRPLQFLVGEWQGKVKYEPGIDTHSEVEWTSHVHYSLGGTILLIDERGSDHEHPDQIGRDVLVVVYWDSATKDYAARFYTGGRSVEGKGAVRDSAFVLTITAPPEQYRFTVRLNEPGQWHEVGENSRDGGESWMRIFEMTLSRQK